MPTLTLEIVQKLLHDVAINTNEFDAIDDPAAEALAKRGGYNLSLNGLTSLSAEAAQALAKDKGELSLNGLTSLSAEAAQALAKHEGGLSLNGLTSLSAEAAQALAKHNEYLFLDGLTSLSAEAAQALAKHEGWLLSLDGLTSLSAEAAQALAEHKGGLSLNGLTSLSAEAAQVLAKHDAAAAFADITDLNIDEFLDQGRSQRDKVRAKSKKYVRGELVKKHFPGEQVKQAGSKAPIEKEYLFVTSMRWAKDPAEQYGFNSYGGFVVFDPASKKLKILMNIRSLDHPEQ
jgi:hypothetical protein